MSWSTQNPLNTTQPVSLGGDGKETGFNKIKAEFTSLYSKLSTFISESTGHKHDGTADGGATIASSSISYDNGTSGLTASNVKTAIDEVATEMMPLAYLDTDNTLAANSDTKVSSQKAIKAYVDGEITDNLVTAASAEEAAAYTEAAKYIAPATLKSGLNASGDAPVYGCRAWVNFNGTGTVAIRGSGNVSSITDSGVGKYVVNFTTAMPDANYAATLMWDNTGNSLCSGGINRSVPPTASALALAFNESGAAGDATYVHVAVFR